MTRQEALYWKEFIEKIIDERVPLIKRTDVDERRISDFAQRFMATITGQQYLPQGVFREFLELFAGIPEIQEEIAQAQERINAWLENLPEECTESEIYAMWSERESDYPFRMDAEGYLVVTDAIVADDGWLVLLSPSLNEDGYIEVENN